MAPLPLRRTSESCGVFDIACFQTIDLPTACMDRDRFEKEHYVSLYRFAWALSGDRASAVELTRRVFDDDAWHAQAVGGRRAAEVALFIAAFRAFAGAKPIQAPPLHGRVASVDRLSLQRASSLSTEALLDSFSGLELPQRAALVLFYTTQCSIHDISAVLHQTQEVTVAIISRGKAEWLHIIQGSGEVGQINPGEPQ